MKLSELTNIRLSVHVNVIIKGKCYYITLSDFSEIVTVCSRDLSQKFHVKESLF